MAQRAITNITKILTDAVVEIEPQQKKDLFQNFLSLIQNQYKNLDKLQFQYQQNQIRISNHVKKMSSKIKSNKMKRDIALREIEKHNPGFAFRQEQIIKKLHIIGLTSYQTLMQIRKIFTGQENLYNFLFKDNTKATGISLKYKNLLKMTSLVKDSSLHAAIRFNTNIKKEINQNLISTSLFSQDGSDTTYSAVYRYYTQNRLISGKTGLPKDEFGIFYEAYEYINEQHGGDNSYIPSQDELIEAFARTRSGSGKGGAFYTGPDTLAQDKTWLGSNPSLTSIPTISTGLKQLYKNLNNFIKTDDTTAIEKLFTGTKAEDNIYGKAKEEAIENIRQTLEKLKLKF